MADLPPQLGVPFGHAAGEIRKGLYLGGVTALNTASELGITHVLSVINDISDLSTKVQQLSMTHMLIDMADMEEANLLPHFEQAVQFIKSALEQGGKVLVHCQAGISRSASVVLAYLMAVEKTGLDSALASIRHTYPQASPNEGFLHQLQLWHEMGYVFNPAHPGYTIVMMRQLAMRYDAGEDLSSITTDLAAPSESAAQGKLYRCRKCRRLLATQSNVVPITEGPGSIAFKYRKRSKGAGEQGEDRGSLWVTPMQWMQELSNGETQGKLYCPSCKARLGSYNWAGSQSESGAWVTPAFQLHHSKVDAMSPETANPINIRRPLVGLSAPSIGSLSRDRGEDDHLSADQRHNTDMQTDGSFVPVDAARTVSDAANAAAQIASDIDRPSVVPRHDCTHASRH